MHFLSDIITQKGNAKKQNKDDERTENIDMTNDRFFAYYKAQNIVPEKEWEQFIQCMQHHLPTTFRLTGSRQCVSPQRSTVVAVTTLCFLGPRKASTT
jgi:multisite-specific tRNA:(cytosine-C5)-methyltransferase